MKKRVRISVELSDNQDCNAKEWLGVVRRFVDEYNNIGRVRLKVQVGNDIERWTNETDKAE